MLPLYKAQVESLRSVSMEAVEILIFCGSVSISIASFTSSNEIKGCNLQMNSMLGLSFAHASEKEKSRIHSEINPSGITKQDLEIFILSFT